MPFEIRQQMPETGICPFPQAVYIFTIEYIDSVPISERFFYFQHDQYRAIFISRKLFNVPNWYISFSIFGTINIVLFIS